LDIKQSIQNANIVLVEGDNKIGKLTTVLYFNSLINPSRITMISPLIKSIMNKRLQAIKMLKDKKINSIIEKLSLLCLKEDWEYIKAEFGLDFLLDDVKKIIKDTNPEVLILHRPEIMFSRQEEEFAKQYIEDVIEICSNSNIKLFVTLEKESFLLETIENFSEINFMVEKLSSKERKIVIKHSLYPIDYDSFILKWEKDKLILIQQDSFKIENNNLQKEEISTDEDLKSNHNLIKNSNKKSILIITKDEYLKKFHNYLFSEEFELEFAKSLDEIISKLLKKPDIVVFHSESEEINTKICESFKNSDTKIVYIVNKSYTRNIDKMRIFAAGCYEVLPKNFIIEEYILLIEKITNNYFYLNKIKFLHQKNIIKNKNHFINIVNNLYNERVYFSVVIGNSKENIISKIRYNDIIYIENETIYLCLIDTNRYLYDNVIKQKLNIEEKIFVEAIEWKEHEKDIINFNN